MKSCSTEIVLSDSSTLGFALSKELAELGSNQTNWFVSKKLPNWIFSQAKLIDLVQKALEEILSQANCFVSRNRWVKNSEAKLIN